MVIGTPAARRGPRHRRGVVGLVMNPVALRIQVEPGASFRDLVVRAHDALSWARSSEELPFAAVVERLGAVGAASMPPVFQAMIGWHHRVVGGSSALPDGWRLRRLPQPGAPVDLAVDVDDDGAALSGYLRYATALFDPATAARAAEALCAVMREGPAAPDRRHADVVLLDGAEFARVTVKWARGLALPARLPAVVARFREQVTAGGDRVAVQVGAATLSYRELDARCRTLADRVAGTGAAAVGLLFERSPDLVVGTLGALMAGTPFVPLDPDLPDERLASMLEDSGAAVVLASPGLMAGAPTGRSHAHARRAGRMRRDANPARGSIRGAPRARVRDVHFGLDRAAQGRGGRAPGARRADRRVRRAGRLQSWRGRCDARVDLHSDISVLELLLPLSRSGPGS